MDDVDLAVLTDIVREINKGRENCPEEEILKDGKTYILVSEEDIWNNVRDLIYQIDKLNDYKPSE